MSLEARKVKNSGISRRRTQTFSFADLAEENRLNELNW